MALDLSDCYEILDSERGASLDQIRASYKRLIKQWHPDRFPNDSSVQRLCEDKMKRITEAYRTLEREIRPVSRRPVETPQPRPSPVDPFPFARPGAALRPLRHRDHWGFADDQGYLRIPAQWDWAGEFSEGLAPVRRGESFGYVDGSGAEVIPARFSSAGPFSEGRALVEYLRFGYIDRNGDWAVRARFEAGTRFSEGLAGVRLDGKWGYIRPNGDWFLLPRFEAGGVFAGGRAEVREDGGTLFLYRDGTVRRV